MLYERLMKDKNESNEFSCFMGVRTIEIREGYARGEMLIRPEFQNVVGSLHGGCFFTLADTIGGVAAASYNRKVTTIDSDLHFLSAGIGARKLCAEAVEVKCGKNISVYDVFISDENGKLLAKGTFSYYNLGTPIMENE